MSSFWPNNNLLVNGGVAALCQFIAMIALCTESDMDIKSCAEAGGEEQCNTGPGKASWITFGHEDKDTGLKVDAFGGATFAFIAALVGTLLLGFGTFKGFQGNKGESNDVKTAAYKQAIGAFGVGLIFNLLYWCYMASSEQEQTYFGQTVKVTLSPQFFWGAGLNLGAFCNIAIALGAASVAQKGVGSGPGPTMTNIATAQ